MGHRLKYGTSVGQIPGPLQLPIVEGKLTPAAVATLVSQMEAITNAVNGGISFGDGRQSTQLGNIDGQTVEFVTPSVADTEFEVPHGLGRVPIGRIVLAQNGDGFLKDSNRGGWNKHHLFFKCSEAGVTFLVGLV
jgi:hypothetical protein